MKRLISIAQKHTQLINKSQLDKSHQDNLRDELMRRLEYDQYLKKKSNDFQGTINFYENELFNNRLITKRNQDAIDHLKKKI